VLHQLGFGARWKAWVSILRVSILLRTASSAVLVTRCSVIPITYGLDEIKKT
jgi:hypothetical protein